MSFPRYTNYKDSGVEWLGEVPAHWEVVPLKHLAEFINGAAFKPTEWAESGIPIIRIQNLNGSEEFNFYDGELDQRYLVHEGDLLFGWSGNRGTSFGPVLWRREEVCALNQHIFRVVPKTAEKRSLFWTLKAVTAHVEDQAHGIIGMVHVTKGDLGAINVPMPPIPDQCQIAVFLNRETAKIDGLVAEQRRLKELLKEKRQIVISHAVTQGLNPHASMKPSGIEWLGDVPTHWRVMGLGKVTLSRCDGPFGSGLKSEHYTASGVRVIRLQNIRSDGFNGSDEVFIDADYYESELSRHEVLSGDILIAGLGDDKNTVGRACVAPVGIEPAMVKADCFRFRLDTSQAFPAFVATVLSTSSAADAGVMSSGSTRSRIPLSVMASRKIAVPPLSEQKEIAAFIDAKTLKFNALIGEAERAIDLLQERRTALISAAVTGQIDVRHLT